MREHGRLVAVVEGALVLDVDALSFENGDFLVIPLEQVPGLASSPAGDSTPPTPAD